MNQQIAQTERTKLKRIPKRGNFDRETVYKILDEAFICHIGFSVEGQTFVIPTAYGRKDDTLFGHGSAASRMMREMSKGINVCVIVTLVDGLVLACSAFHHSMNYRSVVIFGTAKIATDETEKTDALFAFTEHLIKGRCDEVRHPNNKELKSTTVLRLPINEASAKIRTGDPIDDEEDYDLNDWCVLLNLYHILVQMDNIREFQSEVLGKLHGKTSFQWHGEDNQRGRKVWYKSFERPMKSNRHFWASVNYIHNNPVHHGLVSKWQDWAFSGASNFIESFGREKTVEIWREHPILDYGKDWDIYYLCFAQKKASYKK